MQKTTIILVLAVVFGGFAMMTTTAPMASAADIPIPSGPLPTGGGSGGGGGGSSDPAPGEIEPEPEIPDYFREARIRHELDFISGIDISLDASNSPRTVWTHEHDDGYVHSGVDEKRCNGSLWFNIEQGAEGFNFLPRTPEIEIRRRNDEGKFQVDFEFPFVLTQQDVSGWLEPPSGGIGWHDPFNTGLDFGSHISLEHQRDLDWPGGWDEEPVVTTTDDINGHASFWFELAEIYDARLWVDSSTHTIHDEDGITVFDIFEINGSFDVLWTGPESSLPAFNEMFPMVVPEPATMTLLGLGGLAVLKRRRRFRKMS
jgi:hypothetical protein